MSYGFCSKLHALSSSAKILKNRLRFDNVSDSLKVGTFFLRHSVVYLFGYDHESGVIEICIADSLASNMELAIANLWRSEKDEPNSLKFHLASVPSVPVNLSTFHPKLLADGNSSCCRRSCERR